MINGDVCVSSSGEGLSGILESLKSLSNVDVLVGIPEEQSSREGGKVTNVELAFIHTNGSPLKRIPARPFVEPAIEDPENQATITPGLNMAAKAALDGDIDAMSKHLVNAGMQGQKVVRDWFTNPKNNWAPNTPGTIARKGSDRPLIDIGELRKAITFVIREKD